MISFEMIAFFKVHHTGTGWMFFKYNGKIINQRLAEVHLPELTWNPHDPEGSPTIMEL